MPLYEITPDRFRALPDTSFTALGVRERGDLQRLLRTQIEVLDPDLFILSEEFGDWEDSRRRIDLLALDRAANLVVIELKRTNDGGHMDLQAVRYASMVAAMTFDRVVRVHAEYLQRQGDEPEEAEERILDFLSWDEPDSEQFARDVRILLVSEDFGRELTTAVLWLRDRDIDIRCIRMRPYEDGGRMLVDVQQIIPLPEAQDYQVRLREKEMEERRARTASQELYQRFWSELIGRARESGGRHGNLSPSSQGWIGAGSGVGGLSYNYVAGAENARVELYFKRATAEQNKAAFDALIRHREAIEAAFGEPLGWERLDGKRACRIRYDISTGGLRSPSDQWPGLQEELVRRMGEFERAMQPYLERIGS